MNDKIMDLLDKMYIEIQGTKKEFKIDILKLENHLQDTKKELKQEITQNRNDILRLENTMHDKFGVLFDGHKSINEVLYYIKDKLEDIDKTLKKHDLEIKVFRGGKK